MIAIQQDRTTEKNEAITTKTETTAVSCSARWYSSNQFNNNHENNKVVQHHLTKNVHRTVKPKFTES